MLVLKRTDFYNFIPECPITVEKQPRYMDTLDSIYKMKSMSVSHNEPSVILSFAFEKNRLKEICEAANTGVNYA